MGLLSEISFYDYKEILLEYNAGRYKYLTAFTSNHSEQRQIERSIVNEDVIKTMSKALPKIDKAVYNHTLNIGSNITIKDSSNNLNLPCTLVKDKNRKTYTRPNGVEQERIIVLIITNKIDTDFYEYFSDYVIDV